jgi:DNA-binding transcriptional LysR family regulator
MIDKLEFLLAVAREKHFGRAAEACGVTQPTLSAGIKQLEDTLGVLLVKRGSRFLGLTDEGELVLTRARRIVGEVRGLKQEVDAAKRKLAGTLRIAAIPTALPMVASLTAPFRKTHPDVRFTVVSRTSEDILAMLADLEIEVGLTYLDNEPLGKVVSLPLYRERYCLLGKAGMLPAVSQATWADAAKLPLCLLTPDMQNRRIVDRHLKEAGAAIASAVMLESDSIIVLFAHIQSGEWAGIMPEKLTTLFDLGPGIVAIPIAEPKTTYTIGLIAGPREPLTPMVAAFLHEAKRLASVPPSLPKMGLEPTV